MAGTSSAQAGSTRLDYLNGSRLSIGLLWITASCLDHITLAHVVVIISTHSMGDGRLGGRRAAAGRDAGVSEVATDDDGGA